MPQGLVGPFQVGEAGAHAELRFGLGIVQFEGPFETFGGLLPAAQPAQADGAVEVPGAVIRLPLQQARVARRGGFVLGQLVLHLAHGGKQRGLAFAGLHRAAELAESLLQPPVQVQENGPGKSLADWLRALRRARIGEGRLALVERRHSLHFPTPLPLVAGGSRRGPRRDASGSAGSLGIPRDGRGRAAQGKAYTVSSDGVSAMTTHVKVLGILHIAFGALGVIGAIVLLLIFGGIAGLVGHSGDHGAAVAVPILSGLGGILFLLVMALSLPGLVVGVGLLEHRSWARIGGIVLSALNLMNVPIGTALGVYGLWVLLNRETEQLFERPQLAGV